MRMSFGSWPMRTSHLYYINPFMSFVLPITLALSPQQLRIITP
jgi:hypothetical protein